MMASLGVVARLRSMSQKVRVLFMSLFQQLSNRSCRICPVTFFAPRYAKLQLHWVSLMKIAWYLILKSEISLDYGNRFLTK